MPKVRYSSRAELDLDDIAEYTKKKWSLRQTEIYLDDLVSFCQTLARSPGMGRAYSKAHPEWRRIEHWKHIVLYRKSETGILILRILHQKRDVPRSPVD